MNQANNLNQAISGGQTGAGISVLEDVLVASKVEHVDGMRGTKEPGSDAGSNRGLSCVHNGCASGRIGECQRVTSDCTCNIAEDCRAGDASSNSINKLVTSSSNPGVKCFSNRVSTRTKVDGRLLHWLNNFSNPSSLMTAA